eukprot:6424095-Pyramimonas_sp.AAC.1
MILKLEVAATASGPHIFILKLATVTKTEDGSLELSPWHNHAIVHNSCNNYRHGGGLACTT